MEGKISNIQKFSLDDGPGIRTTAFLWGCSLRCRWCHNPETFTDVQDGRYRSQRYSVERLMEVFDEDRDFYETSGGGVTFSGGEALLQTDFVSECVKECKKRGYHICIDTAGNVPYSNFEKIREVLSDEDIFLYDCKCITPEKHRDFTGVDNTLIRDNLRKLSMSGARIWIRVPVIPTFNADLEEMQKIAEFLDSLPNIERVDMLPYHSFGESKYEELKLEYKLSNIKPPENSFMQEMMDIHPVLNKRH